MFKDFQTNAKHKISQSYEQQLYAFKDILNQVIHVDKRENLPRICTQNIELLVGLNGADSVHICNNIMEEARQSNDQALVENTEAAIQYIVYFVETFVTEGEMMDEKHHGLIALMIKTMIGATSLDQSISLMDLPEEHIKDQNLTNFMTEQNKEQFTPGFLRHLDHECNKIQMAPTQTPESMKVLTILRKIQGRVIQEVGQDLGEGAQVLGQLLGYQNRDERLAVLEAALESRGVAYATELNALTAEALGGFQMSIGGSDPSLVAIVQEIHDYIQVFIARHSAGAPVY